MPTYRYECTSCGYAFDLMQTMTARRKRKCPECEKPKLERLIGKGGGIIFRGNGWYSKDYGGKNASDGGN